MNNLGAKFLNGVFLGQRLGGNQRDVNRHGDRCCQSRSDVLNAVVGAPWKPTPEGHRAGDEVRAARFSIAEGGGSHHQCSQYGSTPDSHGCDAIFTRSTAKNHGTQRRERLTTEMHHDERLVRRVQAVEDSKRRRPYAEVRRDAVRPRSMQQDDVENNQSSAELGGDRNRDQSGSGDTQLEGHAVQALAQGSDLLRQCCNETQIQELGVPRSGATQGHGHEQHCDE